MKNFRTFLRRGGIAPFKFHVVRYRTPEFGLYYEADDGAGGGGGGGGDSGGGGDDDPNKGKDGQTFTQKQVNDMLAKEKGVHKTKQDALAEELRTLKEAKNLSEEQRTSLQAQIVELEQSGMTEAQKAEVARKQLETESAQKISAAEKRATDNWARYEQQTLRVAIQSAASKHKAYRADQITAIVSPKCKLVEVFDSDGKTVVDYKVVVPGVDVKNEETGQVDKKDLSADEYVERMKGSEDFANLFVADQVGGTGFRPGSGAPGQAAGANMSGTEKISAGLRKGDHRQLPTRA